MEVLSLDNLEGCFKPVGGWIVGVRRPPLASLPIVAATL